MLYGFGVMGKNEGGNQMKGLIVFMAILAIVGAAWAGEFVCNDPITGRFLSEKPECLNQNRCVAWNFDGCLKWECPRKEKSCRWEVMKIKLPKTAEFPDEWEPMGVSEGVNIWLKRRVCE